MEERTTQWDYLVEDHTRFEGDRRAVLLNTRGSEGWELCGLSDNGNWTFTMVFKRPRPDVPTRPIEIEAD